MSEDGQHLDYLRAGANPVKIVYTYEEGGETHSWAIERDLSGDLLTEEVGHATQIQPVVFGLTAREAFRLRDDKVRAGYQFCPRLSTPFISKTFPGSPFGEIRKFVGRLALDAKEDLIAEFPLDVVREIRSRYILA